MSNDDKVSDPPKSQPTVIPGPGAGTGAIVALDPSSSDGIGQFTITPGVNPVPNAPLATFTFSEPYTGVMSFLVLPANAAAAELLNSIVPSGRTTSAGFALNGTKNVISSNSPLLYQYQITP